MTEACGACRVEHTPGVRLAVRQRPEPGYLVVALVMFGAAFGPWLARGEFRSDPLSAPDSLAVSIGSVACLVAFGLVAVNDWREAILPPAGGVIALRAGLWPVVLDGRDVVGARVDVRPGRSSTAISLVLGMRDGSTRAAFSFTARSGDQQADACVSLMRRALEDLGYARS